MRRNCESTAIQSVSQNKATARASIERGGDQVERHLDFCRENDFTRHVSLYAALCVLRPSIWKIEPPVDQRLPEAACIGQKHPRLAIFDPLRRARMLPRHADRMLALLHKARLIDRQDTVGVAKRLENISAHNVAQRIRRPLAPAEQRLHAIGTIQPRLFRHQPAGFAFHARQQASMKAPAISRPSVRLNAPPVLSLSAANLYQFLKSYTHEPIGQGKRLRLTGAARFRAT